MNDQEVLEFLIRWVMEVGDGDVVWTSGEGFSHDWYGNHTISVDREELRDYFDIKLAPSGRVLLSARINQRGLDKIAAPTKESMK